MWLAGGGVRGLTAFLAQWVLSSVVGLIWRKVSFDPSTLNRIRWESRCRPLPCQKKSKDPLSGAMLFIFWQWINNEFSVRKFNRRQNSQETPHVSNRYERVVYGDHGPYVEFRREHLRLDRWRPNALKQHPGPGVFTHRCRLWKLDQGRIRIEIATTNWKLRVEFVHYQLLNQPPPSPLPCPSYSQSPP